jgi:redox-sensitive bicupin YhaK (pirin superfamily)
MTYLREGTGRHADSMGNVGEFFSPGFQWISVGSGIEHAEGGGTPEGERMHGFQIWINVPRAHKLADPAYGTADPSSIPVLDLGGGSGRLLAGPNPFNSLEGPFLTKQPVQARPFFSP